MVTPFDENLEVNYDKAAELAEYLVNNGSDGVVVCGTTGESPVLSKEEKLKLFAVVKERIGNKAQVWAGTGSNDTRASVAITQEAEKLGVDGALVVAPYYNKPTQEGLYLHFKVIAENTGLPIMVYNIPGRTAVNILPETMSRLCECNNIVAIKEASGDLNQVAQIKRIVPDYVRIYSGDDALTLPMLSIGAVGVVSVASHIVGNEIKDMINAYVNGDITKAQLLHNKLYPMFKGLFLCTNPIPVKEALNLLGHNVGSLRLPLTRASSSQSEQIKDLLSSYNLI